MVLLRNFYIVDTRIGILEAYVRPSITPAAIAAAEELAPPTVRELVEEQGYIEQRKASVRLRLENHGRDYL
jgi:hypothetical protein